MGREEPELVANQWPAQVRVERPHLIDHGGVRHAGSDEILVDVVGLQLGEGEGGEERSLEPVATFLGNHVDSHALQLKGRISEAVGSIQLLACALCADSGRFAAFSARGATKRATRITANPFREDIASPQFFYFVKQPFPIAWPAWPDDSCAAQRASWARLAECHDQRTAAIPM